MNETTPKKRSAGFWIAIGCGALVLLGLCAIIGAPIAVTALRTYKQREAESTPASPAPPAAPQ